jgi:hypothetical protein
MSARQGLGDLFNLATSATTGKTRANLQNAAGVTIVLIGATSGAATINECNAASGGTEQLVGGGGGGVALTYFTQNNGVWTKATGSASTVTAATGGLLAVYIPAVLLADGFTYVDASHASGSFVYILHGLQVKRDPVNLKDVRA